MVPVRPKPAPMIFNVMLNPPVQDCPNPLSQASGEGLVIDRSPGVELILGGQTQNPQQRTEAMATLTVSATHDFSGDVLSNITLIDFTNFINAVATATFSASQFDNTQISTSVAID